MRAIDADDLLEVVKHLEQTSGEYADSFVNAAGHRSIELDRLKDYINNAETLNCPVCGAKMTGGKHE
ncbi:MAG TPA: hypothetical protein DCZ61_06700 [Lachnospiraceae bacterium]|nr:hypothetical protein [Lachnospiraceae bacterium]